MLFLFPLRLVQILSSMSFGYHQPLTGCRWLLRGTAITAILLTLTAAVWAMWWHTSHRRMDALIASLRAKGKPASWSDIRIEDVPDEENAALLYKAACAANSLDPVRKARTLSRSLNIPRDQINQRDAYGFPPLPQFVNRSVLARTIAAAALKEHAAGNEREAVELCRDIERMARSSSSEPRWLIGSLVDLILRGIGQNAIEAIAPAIRLSDQGLTPQEARLLIAQLADDREVRQIVAEGFRRERLNITGIYVHNASAIGAIALAPLMIDDRWRGAVILERAADDIERLRAPAPISPPPESPFSIIPQFVSPGGDVACLYLRRRMAAAMIAVQLYRHEHGVYPAQLSDLVPGYLVEMPTDPRVPQAALMYHLDADGTRPILCMPGEPSPNPALVWQHISGNAMKLPNSIPKTGPVLIDASIWRAPSSQPVDNGKPAQAQAPGQ